MQNPVTDFTQFFFDYNPHFYLNAQNEVGCICFILPVVSKYPSWYFFSFLGFINDEPQYILFENQDVMNFFLKEVNMEKLLENFTNFFMKNHKFILFYQWFMSNQQNVFEYVQKHNY